MVLPTRPCQNPNCQAHGRNCATCRGTGLDISENITPPSSPVEAHQRPMRQPITMPCPIPECTFVGEFCPSCNGTGILNPNNIKDIPPGILTDEQLQAIYEQMYGDGRLPLFVDGSALRSGNQTPKKPKPTCSRAITFSGEADSEKAAGSGSEHLRNALTRPHVFINNMKRRIERIKFDQQPMPNTEVLKGIFCFICDKTFATLKELLIHRQSCQVDQARTDDVETEVGQVVREIVAKVSSEGASHQCIQSSSNNKSQSASSTSTPLFGEFMDLQKFCCQLCQRLFSFKRVLESHLETSLKYYKWLKSTMQHPSDQNAAQSQISDVDISLGEVTQGMFLYEPLCQATEQSAVTLYVRDFRRVFLSAQASRELNVPVAVKFLYSMQTPLKVWFYKEESFYCYVPQCKRAAFTDICQLGAHLNRHSREENQLCSQCQMVCLTYHGLTHHMLLFHHRGCFGCLEANCNQTNQFETIARLLEHHIKAHLDVGSLSDGQQRAVDIFLGHLERL